MYSHLADGVLIEVKEGVELAVRLVVAALLGGLLGYERQKHGKRAGLRTHMLVSLSSATFVVSTVALGGTKDDVSRVVQGVAAGIGFIGAGTILKHSEVERVRGLTTAASLWTASAIGVGAGMGSFVVSIIAAVAGWFILEILARFEPHPAEGRP